MFVRFLNVQNMTCQQNNKPIQSLTVVIVIGEQYVKDEFKY